MNVEHWNSSTCFNFFFVLKHNPLISENYICWPLAGNILRRMSFFSLRKIVTLYRKLAMVNSTAGKMPRKIRRFRFLARLGIQWMTLRKLLRLCLHFLDQWERADICTYHKSKKDEMLKCIVTATGINFRAAFQLNLLISIFISTQIRLAEH